MYKALKGVDIPGLEMTVFNGRCYAGQKSCEGPLIPREIDFAIFLRYQGRFMVQVLEVKGSLDESANKRINKTRGHALAQLRNHKEILGYKHNIPEETFEKVQFCVMWPNLQRHYFCEACDTSEGHERFQVPPETCKLKGNSNQATAGNDFFKDDLIPGNFEREVQRFVEDKNFWLSEDEWVDLRNIFLLLSIGCLFDEMDKTFILLNKEQLNLLSVTRHPMSRPKFIYGPAGSGKTLSTLAMMEILFKKGEIDKDNQVLYLCSNPSVQQYVRRELTARAISLDNVDLKTYTEVWSELFEAMKRDIDDRDDVSHLGQAGSMPHFNAWKFAVPHLVKRYGTIFMDEAEDLGDWNLNGLNTTINTVKEIGHFWILFDHLQWKPTWKNQSRGLGESTKNTTFMYKVYRSTNNNIQFLREEPLIAMCDETTSVGHEIEGPRVQETVIPVKRKGQLNSDRTRKQIVKKITSKVIELTTERGVHPGDIAVTYDNYDYQQIFETFDVCSALDDHAKAALPKNPEMAPKSSFNQKESVLFPHERSHTACKCKYFVGPYKEIKGLTVKVVIFISIQGSTRGYNRLATYTSLTRSSCSTEMLYVHVESMKMVNYQLEKYKIDYKGQNLSVRQEGDDKVLLVSNRGAKEPACVSGSFPSAIGSVTYLKGTSTTTATLTFLKEPKGVEAEWLEGCLIPKTYYSHPIPGGQNFVPGFGQYSIPVDPRKKKRGSRTDENIKRYYRNRELHRRAQIAKQDDRVQNVRTQSTVVLPLPLASHSV